MRSLRAKRGFDLLAVVATLPLWLPLLLVVGIIVRIRLGSPVFFRQKRPGYRDEVFELIKFRTMTDIRDETGVLLPDGQRLTRFGKALRASSLDELPELLNVLRGEMSLVGPRPLLVEYLARYSIEQRRRHEVPPGLTGWAQVNGRNAITWDEKFILDVWYVDHWSLWLDVKILLRTLRQIFKPHGISAPGNATMPEFKSTRHSNPADYR